MELRDLHGLTAVCKIVICRTLTDLLKFSYIEEKRDKQTENFDMASYLEILTYGTQIKIGG